jgi:hypothetical protein
VAEAGKVDALIAAAEDSARDRCWKTVL